MYQPESAVRPNGAGTLDPEPAARIMSAARLERVRQTGLLDSDREEAFDRFAHLASVVLGGITAFVTIVDDRRSFWKACVTASGGTLEARQNTVQESFCQYVIGADEPLVVADARIHPITRDNPSVAAMGVVAWAGFPIRTPDGLVLGTFCAVGGVPRNWSPEDLNLLETLAHAVSGEVELRTAVEDARRAHQAAAVEAERSAELAAVLQESLMPARMPAVSGWDLHAAYRPAGSGVEVLGDFYDAFPVPRGWGVVVGDVCGKGPRAARLTALTRSTVRAIGHDGRDPAAVLSVLDEVLHDWNDGRYEPVAAAYAVVRPAGAELEVSLCLAGLPPALLRTSTGGVEEAGVLGAMLGCGLPMALTTSVHRLAPGDTLLMATDGVCEARGGRGRAFGEDGLATLLAALPHGTAIDRTVAAVLDAIDAHCGGPLTDDVAVVALRNPPAGPRSSTRRVGAPTSAGRNTA